MAKASINTVKALVGNIRLIPLQNRVRPATYAPEEGSGKPMIVIERRYLDGQEVETVLLDSIPSQANRMEMVLYDLRDELRLPDIRVRFPDATYSQWEVPHRPYDPLIRDTHLSGIPFFSTEVGQKLAIGDPATLFAWAPNVLLFGGWNSHAQQGVGHLLAARLERAVSAEVIGLWPKRVARTYSRLDPSGIPGDAPLPPGYEKEKERLGRGRTIKKLSNLGLGNVPPGFDDLDVSITEARHEVVINTAPWRRMGLPDAAQSVLINLTLLALAYIYQDGLYLRSGTAFRYTEPPTLINPLSGEEVTIPEPETLIERIHEGVRPLPEAYRWNGRLLELEPSRALLEAYKAKEELREKKKRQRPAEGAE